MLTWLGASLRGRGLHLAPNLKISVPSRATENRMKRMDGISHPFLTHTDILLIFPRMCSFPFSIFGLPTLYNLFILCLSPLPSPHFTCVCICVSVCLHFMEKAFILNFHNIVFIMQQSLSKMPCQALLQTDRGTC